jgi:Cobyric acid synthase
VSLAEQKGWGNVDAPIQIAVLQLPRISNFTDINAFIGLPDTRVRYVKKGEAIEKADLVIIPGTKNSILDLIYLKEEGYSREIADLARKGAMIAGLCGGYQMLGEELLDPLGTEAGIGSLEGLGLLPVSTVFEAEKSTHQVEGEILAQEGFWSILHGQRISGYEIHMGQSRVRQEASLLEIQSRSGQPVKIGDGAIAPGGRVFGTYLHGIFDNANLMLALTNTLRHDKGLPELRVEDLPLYKREHKYDLLAQTVRGALAMNDLYRIMGL